MNKTELTSRIILEQLGLYCWICKNQLNVKGAIYEVPLYNSEYDGMMLMKKRHICKTCNELVESFMENERSKR